MSRSDTSENPDKANIQGVNMNLVKIKILVRCQPRHKAGVNFIVGASALLTDFEKGRSNKRMTIYVDRPSNSWTVDINMHEHMNPDKPCIGS